MRGKTGGFCEVAALLILKPRRTGSKAASASTSASICILRAGSVSEPEMFIYDAAVAPCVLFL